MKINKEPIRLRGRKSTLTGLTSLYLDIYVSGKRSYEYLHLYLVEEKSRKDKELNRSTLLLAESIKAKRLVELRNGIYGFKENSKADITFLDYYKQVCEEKKKETTIANYNLWMCCFNYLKSFIGNKHFLLSQVDANWLKSFQSYLKGSHLALNTQAKYYDKLCTCIHAAYADELIEHDPVKKAGTMRKQETERMYLTIDELRKLADTPCKNNQVRRAFLFSCLTGLRLSDVRKLTWADVSKQGDFTRISFRQKKTGGVEYYDISKEAAELLGEKVGNTIHTFIIPTHTQICNCLKKWVADANIGKHITFHCARHTFAVMMLDLGTDIYTVSKLLGHKELSTTQIYAKVLDKNKQAAVAKIPTIFKQECDG